MHNSDLHDEVRSYAIRRVNPFVGVLQVIETMAGRATSANGIVWDIQVLTERNEWGSLNRGNPQQAYYRYGLWSLEEGLVHRPLAAQHGNDPLTEKSHDLIACIRPRLEQLPFTLEDSHELWLFDQDDQQPLALLASATPGDQRPSPEPRYWSSSLGVSSAPSQYRYPQASQLEAMVKKRAGFNINKHWVIRQPDGSAIMQEKGLHLQADMLPTYLLTEDWPEAEQAVLATAYLEWIAPSLLTLQHLSVVDRERMENCLNKQAISVEHHWHLYPDIINEQKLRSARVQSRLQRANQQQQVSE